MSRYPVLNHAAFDMSNTIITGAKELAGHYFSSIDQGSITFEKSANGQTTIIKNIPVFRAGTFKDSRGRSHQIDQSFLSALVDNFTALNAPPIKFEPPVRADHSRTVKNVTGYFQNLHFSGSTLYGDVEITEPDVVGKIERRTYRKLSAEIGAYEDNSGNLYEPAFMGVAFVDIPAVEGLSFRKDDESDVRYFMEASPKMPGTETELPKGEAAETGEPADKAPGRRSDAGFTHPLITINTTEAPAAPKTEAPSTFSFGGVEMTFEQVQARLTAAAEFEAETIKNGRATFVKGLVDTKRVAAPQMDALTAFSQGLSDAQFTEWSKLFEGAPELSLLGTHADGTKNVGNDNSGSETDKNKAEYQIALGVVDSLRRTNSFSQEALEATGAFKRMTALKALVEATH